ncbi:uncharacterized protein LOC122312970 [Carya illinoinensis]|uniref:Phorbol-ester/DAG-type domain-containing protein n=1 Tax=Carya illinoinensis TaxID=32201 RepID=A0A8T1Q7A1_CARIL|nr:uncharacterized protein LOC122312970 [Carya illinoinensis]KAG6650278.1 hypothetical protein CIPAW_06G031800 [Carya illinoinensis]
MDFWLDVKCANFLESAIEKTEEQFRTHFGHQHPLELLDNLPTDPIFCCVCGKYPSDPTYGCLECHFFVHRSCFERSWPEEIQHFYHPCLLTLSENCIPNTFCRACRLLLPQGTAFYGCKRCNFVMDVGCTFLASTEYAGNQEQVGHFLHGHPLSLSKIEESNQIDCYLCEKPCNGTAYGCGKSGCEDVYFHKSCVDETQQEILSIRHTQHPLTLLDHHLTPSRCNSCHGFIERFTHFYQCAICNFNLHWKCNVKAATEYEGHNHPLILWENIDNYYGLKCDKFQITTTIKETEEQFRTHFGHYYPLVLLDILPTDPIFCCVCGKYPSDPTYGCLQCHFFIHGSCFERSWPKEIQHFYHPCLLTLYKDCMPTIRCGACRRHLPLGAAIYGCKPCKFFMDVGCTFLASTEYAGNQEQIGHFVHGHPLSLSKIEESNQIDCYLCKKPCNGTTYGCGRSSCKDVYFHESCLDETRQKIYNIHHPQHPLTLLDHHIISSRCNSCREFIKDFTHVYGCDKCDFNLHWKCNVKAAIEYEGHNHRLQFGTNIGNYSVLCRACSSTIECKSHVIRCLSCKDFNLHLECGPLPYRIKDKCHIDSLTLTNSLGEHEDETDDEFYCDACENKRDPRLPTYQCQECQYVAELKCVISEVISTLAGEYGDAELRSPLGQLGRVLLINPKDAKHMIQNKEDQLLQPLPASRSLSDILDSLSEAEKKELLSSGLQIRGSEIVTGNPFDDEKILQFSDESYSHFMKFLHHGESFYEEFQLDGNIHKYYSFKLDLDDKVVYVGDHMVTRKYASIIRSLLSKHGDVSVGSSTSSPELKMCFFHVLCECIYSMSNTSVVEITDDKLVKWWRSLIILQSAGFRIEFAFDRLKRVAHAHFGAYVRKLVDKTRQELDRDIEALTEKRKRIIVAESAKSSLVVECLREAEVLKQSKAGSRLL